MTGLNCVFIIFFVIFIYHPFLHFYRFHFSIINFCVFCIFYLQNTYLQLPPPTTIAMVHFSGTATGAAVLHTGAQAVSNNIRYSSIHLILLLQFYCKLFYSSLFNSLSSMHFAGRALLHFVQISGHRHTFTTGRSISFLSFSLASFFLRATFCTNDRTSFTIFDWRDAYHLSCTADLSISLSRLLLPSCVLMGSIDTSDLLCCTMIPCGVIFCLPAGIVI